MIKIVIKTKSGEKLSKSEQEHIKLAVVSYILESGINKHRNLLVKASVI